MTRILRWLLAPTLLLLVAETATAQTFQVDGVHSFAGFTASRFGIVDVHGRFNQVSGSIRFDAEAPANSSVELEIRTESVDSGNERRDNHLRSPDFFNAKQFPVIRFRSSSIRPKRSGAFEVSGELSLHGVTRPLTLEVTQRGPGKNPMGDGQLIGFQASTTLKRSDFGMTFMAGAIGDEVGVELAIQGMSQ